jgi:uncharacterized phage-associated protein
MPIQEFKFDKAVQALSFLANKEENKMNRMKALKLLYFADRFHLRKYGRPIFNDKYIAMKLGPVGSAIKDISSLSFLVDEEAARVSKMLQLDGQYDYRSISDTDLSVFSKSDIEALEFAYNEFGSLTPFELSKMTHVYPEWKKFQSDLQSGDRSKKMSYLDFFENPAIENDKFAVTEEFVSSSKETFSEQQEATNLL